MELRDLYDENKKLTGETIFKGQEVPKGRYYITVVIFIQNSKNEFLIQKRVKKKDGKWATTGGHPVSGETSKQGIITEIKEELGIDVLEENIELFKTIKTEDDFIDIYYLKEDIDIKKIKIQKEEVEDDTKDAGTIIYQSRPAGSTIAERVTLKIKVTKKSKEAEAGDDHTNTDDGMVPYEEEDN